MKYFSIELSEACCQCTAEAEALYIENKIYNAAICSDLYEWDEKSTLKHNGKLCYCLKSNVDNLFYYAEKRDIKEVDYEKYIKWCAVKKCVLILQKELSEIAG